VDGRRDARGVERAAYLVELVGQEGARIASTAWRTSPSAAADLLDVGRVADDGVRVGGGERRTAWALTTITDGCGPGGRAGRERTLAFLRDRDPGQLLSGAVGSATVSSSAANASSRRRRARTTKPSDHIGRLVRLDRPGRPHRGRRHSGTATRRRRPRTTAGTALASKIQVGSHWLLWWVAPANVAAAMVDSAT
jgi:hypothetical protein